MYRLTRISVTDFGPFIGNHAFELTDGFISVVGQNGTGKTRLGWAVPWCLFGAKALKNITEEGLRPVGTGRTPRVGLKFLGNKSVMEIERNKNTAYVKINNQRVAEGKAAVEAFLLEQFRLTPAVCNAILYVGQGELKSIVDIDAAKRTQALEVLLQLEPLSVAPEMAAKELRETMESMNTADNAERIATVQVEYDAAVRHLSESEADVTVSRGELDSMQTELTAVVKRLEKIHTRWQDNQERVKTLQQLQRDVIPVLQERAKSLDQGRGDAQKEIERLTKQKQQLTDKLDGIGQPPDETKLGQNFKILAAQSSELDTRVRQLTQARDQAQAMVPLVKEPEEDKPDQAYLDKLSESLELAQDRFRIVDKELKENEAHLDGASGASLCSKCGTLLTEKHISALREKHDSIVPRHTVLKMEVEQLQHAADAQYQLYNEWIRYDESKVVAEDMATKVIRMTDKLERTQLESDVARADLAKTSLSLDKAREHTRQYNAVVQELSHVEQMLAHNTSVQQKCHTALNGVIEELRVTQIKVDAIDKTLMQTKYTELDSVVQNLKKSRMELDTRHTILTRDFAKIERKRRDARLRLMWATEEVNKAKAEVDERRKLQEKTDELRQTRESLVAFKKHQHTQVVASLSQLVNQFYLLLGQSDYTRIEFQSDFGIIGYKGDTPFEFNLFSGAQKLSAAMALRLAIRQLSIGMHPQQLGILILDEPTDAFSHERVVAFKELLEKIISVIPQIICITHHPELQSSAQSIRVTMDAEGQSHVKKS